MVKCTNISGVSPGTKAELKKFKKRLEVVLHRDFTWDQFLVLIPSVPLSVFSRVVENGVK